MYCNESFDKAFVELGFPQMLGQVLEVGRQNPPKVRFLKEVVSDLGRFVGYKRKMIGW